MSFGTVQEVVLLPGEAGLVGPPVLWLLPGLLLPGMLTPVPGPDGLAGTCPSAGIGDDADVHAGWLLAPSLVSAVAWEMVQ